MWIEAVFREHYPRLVSLLARLTGNRSEAEEIASDVFCKAARRKLDEPVAWIYRAAMNAGFDALRAGARGRRRAEQAAAETIRTATPGDALEEMLAEERRGQVREVLALVKPRDAQLLLLRAEGLSYRELAQTLGLSAGSVGTLLARAEAEFERRFRARFGGGA